MIPRRDDMVAKEEIFDGTMQKLFQYVFGEMHKLGGENKNDVGVLLKSIPAPYFELYMIYQYHATKHCKNGIDLDLGKKDSGPVSKIIEYLDWRQGLQLQFNPTHLQDVLGGIDPVRLFHLMPECVIGRDKTQQPVVYFLWNRHIINFPEIMQCVTTKHLFDYHVWQHEALVELCYDCSVVHNKMVAGCTLVIDIHHLTTESVSSEFLHIVSRRAEVLNLYFPYLINKVLVVHACEKDTRFIHKIREFCSKIAPDGTVFFSNEDSEPNDLLCQHIDEHELPVDYGGSHPHGFSNLPHPFYDCLKLHVVQSKYFRADHIEEKIPNEFEKVSPLLSLHVSLPTASTSIPFPPLQSDSLSRDIILPPRTVESSATPLASSSTTGVSTTSLQPHFDDAEALYPQTSFSPPFVASIDSYSSRTHSSSSSKIPVACFPRSLSISSPGSSGLLHPRADSMLTNIPMTPNARVALTAFVELFASDDIPITPASKHDRGGGGDENCFTDNVVLSTTIDRNVFSLLRDGSNFTSVGCDMFTNLDFMRNIVTSRFDSMAIKTFSGVVILQKRQGFRKNIGHVLDRSDSNDIADAKPQAISCRKYHGSFALASGRTYLLSRGVSLCGWLQKYPMKSQSWGGPTQRYFILNSTTLRYWKSVPFAIADKATVNTSNSSRLSLISSSSQTVDNNESPHSIALPMDVDLEPCKGYITLTHDTVIRRSKTLFGTSTIEIKSKDDALTICAYTAAEDAAWFSELFNAVEKLKKAERDKAIGSERNFPEITWRSPEPTCVVLDVDVVDFTSVEDKEREFRALNAPRSNISQTSVVSPFQGTYAVLCQYKNGHSSMHSVQIGPHHHIPVRLENSDIDLGVQLSSVKLCGDCLVVSGSHGFVGSGRIPPLELPRVMTESNSGNSNSADGPAQRIYVRRMVNSFHGDDAHVTCLAVPSLDSKTTQSRQSSLGQQRRDVSSRSQQSGAVGILASGDEIGGVCVWRREEGGRGVLHYPTYDGQISKNKHRAGYSWQCVHRARIGNKINALTFSTDGNFLGITTPERALIFDISQLLVDVTNTPERRSRSVASDSIDGTTDTDTFSIRSVVLDDLVGCVYNSCDLSYGVDLSTAGYVKLWKISSDSDDKKGDKIQFMEAKIDSLFSRLCNVKYAKPLRDLFPNTVSHEGILCVNNAIHNLGGGDNGTAIRKNSLEDEYKNCLSDMDASDHSKVVKDMTEENNGVKTSCLRNNLNGSTGISSYTSNQEMDNSVLDGYSVDPFYYSDLCVIDPVRMHLRDWWCDYSSRFLLLGHARLSSLSTFESTIIASSPKTSIAGSLSSLSRSLNESTPLRGGAENSKHDEVHFLEVGRGLDRQSTTMFWSTLTNALGRRVICRYYIPNGYYRRLRESKSNGLSITGGCSAVAIAPLLEDCLRFCLTLSRCLYECLGDEYIYSLLISWKSAALDAVRDILERKCHAVFKDKSLFQEVLRRLELSPDLALSSLNDLIGVMESIKQWKADQPYRAQSPVHQETSTTTRGKPILTSQLTSHFVETVFKSLRDTLSIVYDEQGLQCIIPSSRMIYLRNGGIPPLSSSHFQHIVEDYMRALQLLDIHSSICSVINLLHSLVIDPLNHFERTEPFAVALCVLGLKGVPPYINDVIVAQSADESSMSNRASNEVLTQDQHSVSRDKEAEGFESPVVHKDISIEALISKVAKGTPPWIRFILTSDTDKVIHE